MRDLLLHNKPLLVVLLVACVVVSVAIVNFVIITYNAAPIARPDTPRGAETYGKGKPLTYVVLGDSTTVSQGGEYDKGYARASARYLAEQGYKVRFQNLGVSGARARDVADKQASEAAPLHPDVVLIAVGANDVTHLTRIKSIRSSLERAITTLRENNSNVRIILTGSPDMGTVPRFPEPTRFLAGQRTKQVNAMVVMVAAENNVLFAPIARETGPVFADRPELYAADKFHPTTAGYNVWTPVINAALQEALETLVSN